MCNRDGHKFYLFLWSLDLMGWFFFTLISYANKTWLLSLEAFSLEDF